MHLANTHSLGSMVAQKLLSVQQRPNICFWSSSKVPAPCLTDLGLNHSIYEVHVPDRLKMYKL